MSAAAYVYRTQKGQAEIKQRSNKLQPRARALLFLVDGKRTVSDVAGQAERLGLSADVLADLEVKGLIERKMPAAETTVPASKARAGEAMLGGDAARVAEARRFMNETVVDAAGVWSFVFVLKLERSSTLEELRGLLDQYERAIRKGTPEPEARAFITRTRELLA